MHIMQIIQFVAKNYSDGNQTLSFTDPGFSFKDVGMFSNVLEISNMSGNEAKINLLKSLYRKNYGVIPKNILIHRVYFSSFLRVIPVES